MTTKVWHLDSDGKLECNEPIDFDHMICRLMKADCMSSTVHASPSMNPAKCGGVTPPPSIE